MKLLLDENLSRRIVARLATRFPGTTQVALIGLERATDLDLCIHAERHGFVLCTKDEDFGALIATRGWRPRIVLLSIGNAPNDVVAERILSSADAIEAAFEDPATAIVRLD